MSASDEREAETRRINGTRNKKLSTSRPAWTARLDRRKRLRYRTSRSWGDKGSTPAVLEECTLRLGATHQPVREQHQEESDHSLERARRRRHTHVADGCERPVHIGVDDVSGGVELGRVAGYLVEETEVGIEDPADRKQHVDDDQRLQQRQCYVPDLLPCGGAVQAGRLVILGIDRDHARQVDDAPEATVLPNGDEGEDHQAVAGVEQGEDEVVDDDV